MKYLAWLVMWLDAGLDHVPGWWEGRPHRYGQWGCILNLGRFWAKYLWADGKFHNTPDPDIQWP